MNECHVWFTLAPSKSLSSWSRRNEKSMFVQPKVTIFYGGLSLKGIFGFMMLKEWRKLSELNTLYDRKTTISSSLLHRTCHSINGGSPKTMSIVSLHELFLKLTFFLDFLNSYSRAPSAEYRKQVLHVVSACLETNIQRWCFMSN